MTKEHIIGTHLVPDKKELEDLYHGRHEASRKKGYFSYEDIGKFYSPSYKEKYKVNVYKRHVRNWFVILGIVPRTTGGHLKSKISWDDIEIPEKRN